MDIEETLRHLRVLVATVQMVQSRTREDGDLTNEDRNTLLDTAEAMSENFQALDEWLTSGGYLPHDWQAHVTFSRMIERQRQAKS